jgi:signal peptidase I
MSEQPRTLSDNIATRKRPVSPIKRWVRRVRFVLAGALALILIYIFVSYNVFKVPGVHDETSHAVQSPVENVRKGDTLLMLKLNLWREPRLHDIVIYAHPNPGEGVPTDLIGRIQGLPGENLERMGPTMAVGGREPLNVGFDIGPGAAIQDNEVIPEGHYLIVADTDALAYADSRDFGFVPRESIRQRVALNLSQSTSDP